MKRNQLYLSTIAPDSETVASEYGFGLEIAEYCTAYLMDEQFAETDLTVRRKLTNIPNRILHGPFNELFPCAIDPLARKLATYRYRQAIALAKQYDAKKIVLHGGYNPKLYYPCWYTEQSILFWKRFLEDVDSNQSFPNLDRENGSLIICLENVLEETPDMLLDIVEGVNDPRLKICLDVGHVNAYSSIPLVDWLKICAHRISHFHLHNNTGEFDAHAPLHEGSIDMNELFRLIDQHCPLATCTLEVMEALSSARWLSEQKLIDID